MLKLNSITLASSELAPNPASVIEFGTNQLRTCRCQLINCRLHNRCRTRFYSMFFNVSL